jgi:hypothetical protein
MTCQLCHSRGHVTVKMTNRRGEDIHGLGTLGTCVCPFCSGEGHITEEDKKRGISVEYLNQIEG